MRIFISYPREHKERADKIEAELSHRHFNVFLDVKKINPGKFWRIEIEKHIKKASVFIILYSPAATEQDRFFRVEIDRIEKARKIHILTVVFPPTEPKNLPHYLERRQVISASTNGGADNGNDLYWTDQVIQEVERLSKEKIKQILTFTLTMAAIAIFAGIAINALDIFNHIQPPPATGVTKAVDSKQICESLEGQYKLLEEYQYVYIDQSGIKATSVDGSWEEVRCKHKGKEGLYVLEGKDKTKHLIQININGEYKHVADGINESDSEIAVSEDGGLANRRIFYQFGKEPVVIERNLNEQFWKEYGSDIRNKLKEYVAIIEEKHRRVHGQVLCIPTRGEKDNMDYIASLCTGEHSYVRVMMKVKGR